VLEHYLFHVRGTGDMLLALGLGSLFNHARVPNLDYRVDGAQQVSTYARSSDRQLDTCATVMGGRLPTHPVVPTGYSLLCSGQHQGAYGADDLVWLIAVV
jgi:hypothetical protein